MTDIFQEIDTLIKVNNREMRKDKCRTRWTTFDDGQVHTRMWVCGLVECDFCRNKIAEDIKDRIKKAIAHFGSLRFVSGNRKDIGKIVRYYGKESFLRLPQEDGTDFVFIVTDASIGVELDSDTFNGMNFDDVARSPKGCRQSGELGREKKNEEEFKYEISAYENVVDKPNLIMPSYKKATCSMGIVDSPVNVQELQSLIDKRNGLFVANFITLGGVVYETRSVKKKIKKLIFLTDVKVSKY